jgi:hypothetical protein
LLLFPAPGRRRRSRRNFFAFHSGFWINLHHFLYLEAQQVEAQKGAHVLAESKADSDELKKLSAAEHAAWESAVSYYSRELVRRDLLFDDELIAVKDQLEDEEASSDLAQARIPAELKSVLLEAAPVYRKHWWPRHDAGNRAWMAQVTPLLGQYGAGLSTRMASIYGEP